ncbi:helix-turn-helix transcriptional regulator [Methylomonas fluvii]|uniref:AlpA family phage regulatory protein n=1 Tax=Methylomonas fluvii TaxID=1854564 RepID=A0ABR9DE41_9GAMM|nr:hypothetical protein [Methylomonas fluvii]MBD9361333.1 hypothetical protein [Methylomonas fluvii]CAD6874268.1 hypothetical protein [Methylomonas fluvii]
MKKAMKRAQTAQMAGVCSNMLKVLIETDGFPSPIKVGKADAWIDTEVQAWLDAKIAERDAVVAAGGVQ